MAALLGGAQPAQAGGNFILKRFLLGRLEPVTNRFIATGARGTSNAFRDNVIMLVFSEPIQFTPPVLPEFPEGLPKVDRRTAQIGIPSTGGLIVDAPGDFYPYSVQELDPISGSPVIKRTYLSRAIFDPTRRRAIPALRSPYGLDANSLYSVVVPGLDSGTTNTVRSASGKYITQTFVTTFRTTAKYLQDYTQPSVVSVEASDAPGVNLEGRGYPPGVDSRADVIVTFNEPMLPSTFDPNTTFTVYNNGQGRAVTGTIRASPDGKTFTYRPVFGYGKGPYSITVTVSAALTDRSGNALDKGVVVRFTSEFDPTAPNYSERIETFNDPFNLQEDTAYAPTYDRAVWNNKPLGLGGILGSLVGVFGAKSLDITFNVSGGFALPFWVSQAHTQNLYSPSHMGNTARTVTGFAWRYYTGGNAVGGTYPNLSVQMGHNTTGSCVTGFTGSYSDTAVNVVPAANYSPSTSEVNWISGPTYTANWPYNGRDHVILDINNPTGGPVNYWSYTTSAQGGTTMMVTYNGGTAYPAATWNHDCRFFYQVDKSEAQSKWYDTGVQNPIFFDPIVTQNVPAGTSLSIVYQGAHESALIPGTPDLATVTPQTTDPTANLGGYRFIRFKADFVSNIGSATRPQIDELKFAFIYY